MLAAANGVVELLFAVEAHARRSAWFRVLEDGWTLRRKAKLVAQKTEERTQCGETTGCDGETLLRGGPNGNINSGNCDGLLASQNQTRAILNNQTYKESRGLQNP